MTQRRFDADESLLRDLAPQVLAILIRRFGDFAAAEDAVQEALIAATRQWPQQGVPSNPRSWLIHVASQRMRDHIRAEIARRRRESMAAALSPCDPLVVDAPDAPDETHADDSLLLLFMCCHPALTRYSAIALTLRAVGGLTTAEIANAFLVPEATMAQRISRAKQRIKSSGVPFRRPDQTEWNERLDAVLHVLYLIFNEGYAASIGPTLQRRDLAGEAIRLTRSVHRLLPQEPEVAGLLALMLLTHARSRARTDPAGRLVPLQEQDRTLWDRRLIDEGTVLVTEAIKKGAVGAYQIQAAIAALHDEAVRPEETDWPQIAALYGLLQRMTENPMVTLNQAVAVAMVDGPDAGLRLLEPLDLDKRIAGHYRLAAVRAHLYEMSGEREQAVALYRAAASATRSLQERAYLLEKAARQG